MSEAVDMNRRDFISLWLASLFLALFPWLRGEGGIAAALRSAEAMVSAPTFDFVAASAILKARYSQRSILDVAVRDRPFLSMVRK